VRLLMCMGKVYNCGAYYKVYETNHPGAIIEVLGRRNAGAPWISIWTGAGAYTRPLFSSTWAVSDTKAHPEHP